ncbi:MAG: pyridoxamine 5'-phosphate oxidase [Crocinitomicaceae bacterium]|nr:pyridoxamine 5'-phosphate oxidase [Crocinitomicaceae bacterium]
MDDFLDAIRNDHHNFDKGKLSDHFGDNPLELFKKWYKEAFESTQAEPNAMSLSTVSEAGKPSSRILYLKELAEDGFVFYTNYQSEKGKNLESNPNACLLFFWNVLEREVRIEGKATKVSAALSDEYFASRPRGSQLGAWASHQSDVLEDRSELEARLVELAKKYPNEVPRPPHWGGYVIEAQKLEFWQGRPSRLHDRIVFEKENDSWEIYRKNP